jgi:glycosyltransferase involved in cell wall biosynthesis
MGTRIAREADALVVPTKAVADRLAGCFPGERANRIVVIPNPLPVNRFRRLSASSPGDDDRAARLGLPAEGFLLFVGTQEPRKGLDVLLSALKEPGGPRLPLLLVGPQGWGGVQIGSRDGRVRALGRLDEDDLAVSYRRATVVVLPSRAEGFGYPVVEAMAAGTAVVTSDEPALMETAGGAALTAPIGDAPALANVLRRVERDEVLRAELSGRGRERVRDFNPDDYGRRMWELYDAVSG